MGNSRSFRRGMLRNQHRLVRRASGRIANWIKK